MNHANYSKTVSIAIIAVIYTIAIAIGIGVFEKLAYATSEIRALLVAVWFWGIRLTANWAAPFSAWSPA